MKINLKRLEKFVNALAQVVPLYPEVAMQSGRRPCCGTPGCHAGLIYNALPLMKCKQPEIYYFNDIADWLARYVFNSSNATQRDLEHWAEQNPKTWGNRYGYDMFFAGLAFGQKEHNFPSQIILDHWRGVLGRMKNGAPHAENH